MFSDFSYGHCLVCSDIDLLYGFVVCFCVCNTLCGLCAVPLVFYLYIVIVEWFFNKTCVELVLELGLALVLLSKCVLLLWWSLVIQLK